MDKQDFCESCEQKHNCQEVYRQLGKAEGPSVVSKVVVAFLLPLVVFVVSLVVFEKILDGAISRTELRAGVSFLLALSVTCVFVVGCSLLARRKIKEQRAKSKTTDKS